MCVLFFFWEGASYHDRRYQPCSSWILVDVGYEWQIHSLLDCYKSLDGVAVPILVTGCWLSLLGYTREVFSIQGGHQYFWCKLLLHCIVHVDIFHQENLWCLTDIFHWWKCCMLIDFWEDNRFYQYRILLQKPGWYLLHTLCWDFVFCAITLLGIYLW